MISSEAKSQLLEFADSIGWDKPSLEKIGEYIQGRLNPQTTFPEGIALSKDTLGNTVYTSTTKTELTLAGEMPATLLVSNEGKELIRENRGLIQQIHRGELKNVSREMGRYESRIYQVELLTKEGKKAYVIKYFFPVYTDERLIQSSGLLDMKLMRLAEKEKPIPFIQYVVPLFATHDMSLAPYISKGVSTEDVFHIIQYPEVATLLRVFNDHDIGMEDRTRLRAMMEYQQSCLSDDRKRNFYAFVSKVTRETSASLKRWVEEKIRQEKEFKDFLYDSSDTGLVQSVISVEQFYKVFQLFIKGESEEQVRQELLKAIALVEVGVGRILIEE